MCCKDVPKQAIHRRWTHKAVGVCGTVACTVMTALPAFAEGEGTQSATTVWTKASEIMRDPLQRAGKGPDHHRPG